MHISSRNAFSSSRRRAFALGTASIGLVPRSALALSLLASGAVTSAQVTKLYSVTESTATSLGWSVSGAGDVDLDGYADLLVGRPTAAVNGTGSGSAQLLSGRDGSIIYEVYGDQAWDMLGTSVAGGGDIDADGYLDFAAGAIDYDYSNGVSSGLGYVRVYSGRTGTVLREIGGPVESGLVESSFGRDIAIDGDIDGDGHADILAGGHGWSFGRGRVQLVSGATGFSLGFFNGNPDDWLGMAVAFAGDLDGDGKDEILMGAPGYCLQNGHVVVIDPQTGILFNRVDGLGLSDGCGANAERVGDVNADGIQDYGVVSFDYNGCQAGGGGPDGTGYLRVYSGSDHSLLHYINGSEIVALRPFYDVAPMGDIDGDGHDDFLFGNSGPSNTAAVHSGRTGAILYSFSSQTPYAFTCAALGDANGDGFQDVAVGVLGRVDVYTLAPQIQVLCIGDGSGTSCPCGNNADMGTTTGCKNSFGYGTGLVTSGSADASADMLSLHVYDAPAGVAVMFYQGASALNGGAGTWFGDGLRCIGGTLVRLGARVATSTGTSGIGAAFSSLPLTVLGQISVSGGARVYQAHYRNSAFFCTSSTFNMTNGIRVIWIP